MLYLPMLKLRCEGRLDKVLPVGIFRRLIAVLIDITVLLTIFSLGTSFILLFQIPSEIGALAGLATLIFYVGWFYSREGGTPGKIVLGLRVLDRQTGGNLTFSKAILREFIGKFLSSVLFMIGFVLPLFRKDKSTLHDLVVGTRVIREDSTQKWLYSVLTLGVPIFAYALFLGSVNLFPAHAKELIQHTFGESNKHRSDSTLAVPSISVTASQDNLTLRQIREAGSGLEITVQSLITGLRTQTAVFNGMCYFSNRSETNLREKLIPGETLAIFPDMIDGYTQYCSEMPNAFFHNVFSIDWPWLQAWLPKITGCGSRPKDREMPNARRREILRVWLEPMMKQKSNGFTAPVLECSSDHLLTLGELKRVFQNNLEFKMVSSESFRSPSSEFHAGPYKFDDPK